VGHQTPEAAEPDNADAAIHNSCHDNPVAEIFEERPEQSTTLEAGSSKLI
jgi:hypothetical protein